MSENFGGARRAAPHSLRVVDAFAQSVVIPLAPTAGRFANFDIEFPVMGWALLTFIIGTLSGALLKRALSALFLTLAAFAALRIYVLAQLRPNYLTLVHVPTGGSIPDGAWTLARRYLDGAGREVEPARVASLTRSFETNIAAYQGDLNRYFADNGVVQTQSFQPAERYWTFQLIELSFLLVVSLICIVSALWLVRRVKG